MKEFKKETGFFESFDGAPIYYETRGQGKPLLFLYGIACSDNHWHHQIKDFSDRYQTITMDYRGHQKTPLPKENISIEALAQDVIALIEFLGFSEVLVCGHSFASQVMLLAYEKRPDLFRKMVFINSFATNPLKRTVGYQYTIRAFQLFKKSYKHLPSPLSQIWKYSMDHPLSQWLSTLLGGFNSQLSNYSDIEIYSRGVSTVDLDVFIQLFDEMVNFNGVHILKEIKIPTLIIGGAKDKVTPPVLQYGMHKNIEKSQIQIIPFGSHCAQLDMPELVSLHIEKFIR